MAAWETNRQKIPINYAYKYLKLEIFPGNGENMTADNDSKIASPTVYFLDNP